jgi:hypothetical protein
MPRKRAPAVEQRAAQEEEARALRWAERQQRLLETRERARRVMDDQGLFGGLVFDLVWGGETSCPLFREVKKDP